MNTPEQFEDESDVLVRLNAIAQLRQGRPLREVAQELRITVAALCGWIAEAASVIEEVHSLDDGGEKEELQRLRLENEYLRKQRDFYRKAAGIVCVERRGRQRL
jgi:transposase